MTDRALDEDRLVGVTTRRLEVVVQVQLDLSRDLTDDQVEVGIGPIRLRQYDVGGPRLMSLSRKSAAAMYAI